MDRTLIISDIHLGSDACEAKSLNTFLRNAHERYDRLILNGDVFESMDFRRLKKQHWKVLSKLRRLSDQIEVVWVCGNHDGPADIISHLLGLTVVNDYEFTTGALRILVTHGHIFDKFLDDHPFLTWLGDMIYNFLQKIDQSHYVARMAKHSSKHYLRCLDIVRDGAIALAEERGCRAVCCGHTHHARADQTGPIHYYNSGCWTERPPTYLHIENGVVEVRTLETSLAVNVDLPV